MNLNIINLNFIHNSLLYTKNVLGINKYMVSNIQRILYLSYLILKNSYGVACSYGAHLTIQEIKAR